MALDLIVNLLFSASLLGILGYGFALTYKTFGFFNLSHASAILIGAYSKAVLDRAGYPTGLVAVVSVVLPTIVFYLLGAKVIFPVASAVSNRSVLLVLGLGIASMFSGLIRLAFGPLALESGARVDSIAFRVAVAVLLLASLGLSHLVLKRSRIGRTVQAVSQNWELSGLFGVNVARVASLSFALAGGGAAMVGLVLSYESNVNPTLGIRYMLLGAAGGLIGLHPTARNPLALAAVGAAIIGILNELAGYFVPSEFRDLATGALIVVSVVLSQVSAGSMYLDGRES